MKGLETDRITWSVHIACLLEVSADKPGNVTWGKDFWDTRFVDFMASAIAIGPAFRHAVERPVGQIVLQAVQDTQRLANTNTNLGMILLLAPLAKAAGATPGQGLRAGVRQVLQALTVEDARLVFEGIRLANPGGLGSADEYDVHQNQVDITLLEAMELAQERDSVAREYTTDFQLTFELGFATLKRLWDEGHAFGDALVQTYLTILSQVPDTLIVRKQGWPAAQEVSRQAAEVLQAGGALSPRGREAMAAFDRAIRDPKHRLNPGTTADLVAATLFTFLIEGDGLENFPALLQRW